MWRKKLISSPGTKSNNTKNTPPPPKCIKNCSKWNITNIEGIIWNKCEKYETYDFTLLSKTVKRLISFMLPEETIWWKEDVLTHENFSLQKKIYISWPIFLVKFYDIIHFVLIMQIFLLKGDKIKTTCHLTLFYNCFL